MQNQMAMPLRKLGHTDVTVSAIGMGCMPLSLSGRPGEEYGITVIEAALEQGITFFDTADSYCQDDDDFGHNERLLAAALKGRPEALIATKGGHRRPEGRWQVVGDAPYLRQACEASLRALGREAITLYQFHRPDPQVPFVESVGALADLRREGKIIHVGLSNVTVEQLDVARSIVPIASVQNRLNLFDRSSYPVMQHCAELGIAFLPYSPLNGMSKARRIGDNAVLSRIAAAHHASPQQVALAWLLQLSPVVIPIPGASRTDSILDSAQSYMLQLSAEEIAELDAIS